MKKVVRKIILTLIIIFITFSIYQENKVFALSEEVKREVSYQEGQTDDYTIKIDGADLTADIKIPSIEYTLEDVLYGKQELTSVDFFDKNSSSDTMWIKIRSIVINGLRAVLTVCLALMLTFIIYIGLDIVIDSFSSKGRSEEGTGKRRRGRLRSVATKVRNKKGAEQWLICFISLGLVVFVLNILISFSETIINGLNFVKPQDQKIKVYVEGAVIAETTITDKVTDLIFLGDSRTVQMEGAVDSTYIFVAKGSEGYNWMMQSGFPEVEERLRRGTKVIVWLGVNDPDKQTEPRQQAYADALNEKAKEWGGDGVQIAFATVGPCRSDADNDNIKAFNDGVIEKLSDNIQVIDVYSFMKNGEFEFANAQDYAHYSNDTYQKVYDYMVDQALNGKGTKNTVTKVQDFSFITNAEGLCVFQTNHSWAKNASMNFRYLIYAGCLAISRTVVYVAYIVRMILIGLLIIISPILIVINALKMMEGNKGFLKKWIGLFLYLLFFNAVIKLIYEVLAGTKLYSVVEKPWYVAIVHVFITLITIFSIFMMYRLFLRRKKKKRK